MPSISEPARDPAAELAAMPRAETFAPAQPIGRRLSGAELTTTISHFHRAEAARMAGWRDRLDRTSNWAITVVAALLSVSLSTPNSHHGVLLFAMLLVFLLLWIEARRYRFFDVYRARVRLIERCYFAELFAPSLAGQPAPEWLPALAASLREPQFLISQFAAFARRLRRNYIYLFMILLLAWVLKIVTPKLQDEEMQRDVVSSFWEAVGNASLGPLPGWLVFGVVAALYTVLGLAAAVPIVSEGEVQHGSVHV